MKKIEKLTPGQVARFGEWSKKWIDIGLSTETADFDLATDAALRAYQLCNLEKPMVILRVASPYAATIGGAYAWVLLREFFKDSKGKVEAQVIAQVRDQVDDQVWAQVRAQVGAQVKTQVEDQVWDQVWTKVDDQVEGQVGAQVRDQVWDQVWDQVGDQGFQSAKDGAQNYGYSNLWCSFTAFATFFRDVCGWGDVEILKKLQVNEDLARSCGWTWWHQNVLAISDRPKHIKRDDQGRLHCENGTSIEYRDGWGMYHWHGVSIPKEWVTTQKPTAKEAITWSNIEQRRAACEIVGWASILSQLDAKVIDKDDDEEIGTLLEVDLPDSGRERFLQVKCGTGRTFALPMPKTVNTALEANAWSYGLENIANQFKPEIRT